MSEYIRSTDRAKVIRKAFAGEFGSENVSVHKGSGTACGWVESHIYAKRPAGCSCVFTDKYWNGTLAPKPYRSSNYCEACSLEHKRVDEIARKLEREAMKSAGYEHSTYYADDGYNSEHSEYLQQVSIL